jgi:hypothetical protein
MVESLASYITRLASAHCVSPGSLFARLITPMTNPRRRNKSTNQLVRTPELSMNSCGELPGLVVNAVQTMTRHSNLRLLTLLDWRDAFSQNNLVRATQAWCPCCYEEWRTSGAPLFQPLIWSIAVITVCDLHRRPLRLRCPACDRAIGPFGLHHQPGCCTKCGTWLGESADAELNDTSSHKWLHHSETAQLKDLLATSADRRYQGQIGKDLRTLVKNSRWRSYTSFAKAAGIVPTRLFGLFDSRCRPSLSHLLAICATAEISLKELLRGSPKSVTNNNIIKDQGRRRRCHDKWTRNALREKVSEDLAAALVQSPPISAERAAYGIGVSLSYLKKVFPKEVAQLSARLTQYRRERVWQIERILTQALESSDPPSNESLASQSGFSFIYMRKCYPELYQKLVNLRRASRPLVVIKRKEKRSEEIRCAALALHERGEYPSMRKVLRELGWSHSRQTDTFTHSLLKEIRTELGIPTAQFGHA